MRLPLALTVCTCFSWRNTLEALLCGGQAYTRDKKHSRSDTRFTECFHSSEVPTCLFQKGKEVQGAETAGPGAQEAAVRMCPQLLRSGRQSRHRKAGASDPRQPLKKGLPASSGGLLRDFQYFQTKRPGKNDNKNVLQS